MAYIVNNIDNIMGYGYTYLTLNAQGDRHELPQLLLLLSVQLQLVAV
jgi:hypothetical protein